MNVGEILWKKPYDSEKLLAGCKGPDQGYLIWKFQDKATSAISGKFTICKNLSMDRFCKERVQPILGPGSWASAEICVHYIYRVTNTTCI